jgi:hypothetical protein
MGNVSQEDSSVEATDTQNPVEIVAATETSAQSNSSTENSNQSLRSFIPN